jgi:hypothetical protein
MTLYKSEQTYFATHLLHSFRCAHQELFPSYPVILSSFAFFSMKLLDRCISSPYIYYTKGLHTAVVKPTYASGSSSPIADHFISHKDTSDWSSADPSVVLSSEYFSEETNLKGFVTSSRDVTVTTDPCHYCIASVTVIHYC